MGWTHSYSSPYAVWKNGHETMPPASRQKEIDKMLTWEQLNGSGHVISTHRVLKSAMVGSVYYAAVTTEVAGQPTKVFAVVFLTCGRTKHDGCIWGYKDMDETMGPCESKCPASILALLTPTDSKYANEWRERCRKNIAEAADRRKNGPKPLYAPKGVSVRTEGRSWIVANANVLATGYSGVRYTKAKWRDFDFVMRSFLANHGTAEQRAEYAASGRECPESWKGAAA